VQAAVRETKEETGIDCEITGLVGIYTDPKHVILDTSNGEVRQEFSIVLTARATGGEPARSDESSEVRWARRDDLVGYLMDRSMRLRIGHFHAGRETSPGLTGQCLDWTGEPHMSERIGEQGHGATVLDCFTVSTAPATRCRSSRKPSRSAAGSPPPTPKITWPTWPVTGQSR